ncbi:MAG: hypothetical protein R3B57_12495 [Phycisphaerales bacterium]
MTARTPLLDSHRARGGMLATYGTHELGAPLVAAFAPLELEYAALRRHCVLFDAAHRATLELTGADRLGFLNNMLTQRVADMRPGESRDSFWLNRKGRLVADLRLTELGDRTLIDVDLLVAEETRTSLEAYVFAEDVRIEDATPRTHRLWLIGPSAARLLDACVETPPSNTSDATTPPTAPPSSLPPNRATRGKIDGVPVVIDRHDLCAELGFELSVPSEHAERVYARLLELGEPHDATPANGSPDPLADHVRLRPCGWHAINVARLEAGAPIFNLDFDATNLPAETGLLRDRVDFKKGCYLGQEIVARMDALGHPKQTLIALRFEGREGVDDADIPAPGAELRASPDPEAPAIGHITSSTISPMLGAVPIALAMVRWGSHTPGGRLTLLGDGGPTTGVVQDRLRFWPPPRATKDP